MGRGRQKKDETRFKRLLAIEGETGEDLGGVEVRVELGVATAGYSGTGRSAEHPDEERKKRKLKREAQDSRINDVARNPSISRRIDSKYLRHPPSALTVVTRCHSQIANFWLSNDGAVRSAGGGLLLYRGGGSVWEEGGQGKG